MLDSGGVSVHAQDLCCNPECFPAVDLQALLTNAADRGNSRTVSPFSSITAQERPSYADMQVHVLDGVLPGALCFQTFPFSSPTKKSVITDFNTYLTLIVCYSL